MSEKAETRLTEKEALRIVLDQGATQAYLAMVEKLKAENSCVKFHPSQFVSFLVSDFLNTYFEKDKAVLVAEFFDSQTYYESEAQRAKGQSNFEELMDIALATARRIKGKARSKNGRAKEQKQSKPTSSPVEKV